MPGGMSQRDEVHLAVARVGEVAATLAALRDGLETGSAGAENDATYLLAGVDVVGPYTLYDINRTKLERLIHRILAPAQSDLEITDGFGRPVRPREWFLVPLRIIHEVVARIEDGSMERASYDPGTSCVEVIL